MAAFARFREALERDPELLELHFAELDFAAFGLDGDFAGLRGAVGALVDLHVVHPNGNAVADALDHHLVPLAERLLCAIGEVLDSANLVAVDAPVFLWSAAGLHVWNNDVFADAPEVARVATLHLHFHTLREHAVKSAELAGMDEDAAVAGLRGESVFDGEAVVGVGLARDEVSSWGPEADEEPVPNDEGFWTFGILIKFRYVHGPTREVLAVE